MKIFKKILEQKRLSILFERCYCIQELNGNVNKNTCIDEIAGLEYCKKCKHGKSKKYGGKRL